MTFRPTQNMFNAASVIFTLVCLLTTASFAVSAQADTTTSHAIAMHGDAKYGKDFAHFDYVNPDAPKGGIMNLSGAENLSNFNGFITRACLPAVLDFSTTRWKNHRMKPSANMARLPKPSPRRKIAVG